MSPFENFKSGEPFTIILRLTPTSPSNSLVICGDKATWIKRQSRDIDQLAQYLGRYIMKHTHDERLQRFHSYLTSRGLTLDTEDKYVESIDEFHEYLDTLGKSKESQCVSDQRDPVQGVA